MRVTAGELIFSLEKRCEEIKKFFKDEQKSKQIDDFIKLQKLFSELKKNYDKDELVFDNFYNSFKKFYLDYRQSAAAKEDIKVVFKRLLTETNIDEKTIFNYNVLWDDGKILYFSYITKLLNLFNKDLPIYDSRVETALRLTGRTKNREKDKELYEYICALYAEVIKNSRFKVLVNKIDALNTNEISDARKLDFMVWVLGSPDKN